MIWRETMFKKLWQLFIIVCIMFVLSCNNYGNINKDTIKQLEKKANSGDVVAQRTLAERYLLGEDVEIDDKKSFYWMKKAAENGDALSQRALFFMFAEKKTTDLSQEEAFYWLTKAADADEPLAQYILGWNYGFGRLIERDYHKAFYYINKAVRTGAPEAQYGLGVLYFYGYGCDKDMVKGYSLILQAASKAYTPAIVAKGRCLLYGDGVEKNIDLAIEDLKNIALNGSIDGAYYLSIGYIKKLDLGNAYTWAYIHDQKSANANMRALNASMFSWMSEEEKGKSIEKAKDIMKELEHKNVVWE